MNSKRSGAFFWMVVWLLSMGGAPAVQAQEKKPEELELTGTLAPTVEEGGWVLTDEGTTYLLLQIGAYEKKDWFKKGARVRVWGHEEKDTMTFFMQGKPFVVSRMELLEPAGS